MLSVNMWNDCQNHGHVWLAIYNNNNTHILIVVHRIMNLLCGKASNVHECNSNSINGFYHTIVTYI